MSVVVLTKNGGERFGECLAAILSQQAPQPFDIVVVDSGSTDGTLELLRGEPRVTLVTIPPHEFQHGRTRNLAMERARGSLVAFLTQDAVPGDSHWLASWVEFMDRHPEVAGAFGYQRPHAGADPLEAWEVVHHFDSFLPEGPVRRAAGEGAGPHERLRAHFFSNVNSCVRREAWMRIPFREIPFGEDQVWAADAQRAGLAVGFCREAAVRHSHDYRPLELLRRRYDEARFMKREFGLEVIGSWSQASATARAHAGYFGAQLEALHPGGAGNGRRARARAWASALGNWAGARLASREGALHRMLSMNERMRLGTGR